MVDTKESPQRNIKVLNILHKMLSSMACKHEVAVIVKTIESGDMHVRINFTMDKWKEVAPQNR